MAYIVMASLSYQVGNKSTQMCTGICMDVQIDLYVGARMDMSMDMCVDTVFQIIKKIKKILLFWRRTYSTVMLYIGHTLQ